MARRGNNIYRRKDGRWEGRFKPLGHGKYRSVYGKSYTETREKLIEAQKQVALPSQKCSLTVKELFGLWLAHIRYKVKESSYANYIMKLELHIYPAFGAMRFDGITTQHVNDFISEKLSCGRLGGGALSAKYVSDIVVLLKSAGKFAEREYGYSNPVKNIITPKARQKDLEIPPRHEQKILINWLIKNLNPRNLGILLCLYTGIRLGELCALKWADVNFYERVIRINKTVQRVKRFDGEKKTALVTTSPKSEKSSREIPVPDFLMTILYKCRQPADCFILGSTNRLVEPRLMQYHFKAALKKARLPSINFHATRHIFATNCLICGFDIKTLSEILGHATVELTLNRYVHSSKERKRECMDKLRLIS